MVNAKIQSSILVLLDTGQKSARVIISGTFTDNFYPNEFGLSNVRFCRQGDTIEADLLLEYLSKLSELYWVTGIGLAHETTGTRNNAA